MLLHYVLKTCALVLISQSVFSAEPQIKFFSPERGTSVQEITSYTMGENVIVRLSHLPPWSPVIVTARNKEMLSCASFLSNQNGEIDLSRDPSYSGTYYGVNGDGLFWSMIERPLPKNKQFANYFDARYFHFAVTINGRDVAQSELKGFWNISGVKVQKIDNGLVGDLALPPGDGKHPGIIVIGGSEGPGSAEILARYFASHGYAALGLSWFGADGLPKTMDLVPLEYFEKAIEWLASQARVDKDRIAVYGHSRGGEAALLVGSYFPRVKAVVALVPSGVVIPGVNQVSTWTFQGKPLPALKRQNQPNIILALQDLQNLKEAEIPVEKINGPVLMIAGAEDHMTPPLFTQIAFDRLKRFKHRFKDELIFYPGAGHLISILPGTPGASSTMKTHELHPILKVDFSFGGDPYYTALARRAAREKVLTFLKTNF